MQPAVVLGLEADIECYFDASLSLTDSYLFIPDEAKDVLINLWVVHQDFIFLELELLGQLLSSGSDRGLGVGPVLALDCDMVERSPNALTEDMWRVAALHLLLPLVVDLAGMDQHCLPHYFSIQVITRLVSPLFLNKRLRQASTCLPFLRLKTPLFNAGDPISMDNCLS